LSLKITDTVKLINGDDMSFGDDQEENKVDEINKSVLRRESLEESEDLYAPNESSIIS